MVGAPHVKHSRLRGHATTQVSRPSFQREVKASPRVEPEGTEVPNVSFP